MEIEAKVIEIVAKQFDVSKEKVSRGMSFKDDLAADSLDTVEIIMNLEDNFDISIPETVAEEIKTVGDAISYVEKAKKKA